MCMCVCVCVCVSLSLSYLSPQHRAKALLTLPSSTHTQVPHRHLIGPRRHKQEGSWCVCVCVCVCVGGDVAVFGVCVGVWVFVWEAGGGGEAVDGGAGGVAPDLCVCVGVCVRD